MDLKGDIGQLIAGLPQTEPRVLARARESMINGRNDLALQILQAAVSRTSSSNLRIALGHVLARERRYKDAMGHMVSILREEPRNSEALLLLTDALLECGEYDRAAKMLDRAHACNADPQECERLQGKLTNLTGETATNVVSEELAEHDRSTRPDHDSIDDGPRIRIDSPQAPARERLSTMPGGRPVPQWDVGDPKGETASQPFGVPGAPETPETLQSGTFSTLASWSDDATIESGLNPGPAITHEADDTELGAVISEAFDDFEIQDTMAFVPDDKSVQASHEYANPTDQTAAIVFNDEDNDEVRQVEREVGEMPSVEYEEVFETEVRGQFEDEEPTKERDAWKEPPGDPTRDDVPSRRGVTPLPREEARPSGGFEAAPAQPIGRQAPEQPPRQPVQQPAQQPAKQAVKQGGFQAPAPAYDAPDSKPTVDNPFGSPTFSDPSKAPPRRQEPTGLTPSGAASGATEPDKSRKRSWLPLVTGVVVLVALVLGAVGTVMFASHQQSGEIAAMMDRASESSSNDTYTGYVSALEQLDAAVAHDSFLGRSIDEALVGILPPMGEVTATDLKRTAIARRAYLAAFVEFRFEKNGTRGANERIVKAEELAANSVETVVARAYHYLSEGRPHSALEVVDSRQDDFVGDLLIDQARVDAHLNFDQPAAAAVALKNFRTLEKPTLYQKFLTARVDLALEDPAAAATLDEIRTAVPEHLDSRIAAALAVEESEESREEAKRSIKAVETKFKEAASAYQLAQTSIARGHLHEIAGEKTEAEKAYRTAIRKFPARPELYIPLVRLKSHESDHQSAGELLEKAREEGATHPLLTIERARLLVLKSRPSEVVSLLEEATFDDGRKDLYMGLAHLELGQVEEARADFEAATKRPRETPGAAAFMHVADARNTPSNAEDAMYQVDRLASKHPKNAFVHWASALVRVVVADQLEDRDDFETKLDEAEKELNEATDLDPGWPLFHYTLCDVNLRGLEGKDATRACETGEKLAPEYVPGLVTFAEVHLQQGDFEKAEEILSKLAEKRPNDDRIALLAARTAIELGDHEKAESTINAMLGKPISNGFEMKLLEGRLAFAQRNYAKAAGYLASAHELRPQDGEAGVLYATTLARLGKFEEAEEVVEGHLRDRSWSAAAWTTFGEIRRRQERYRDAFENLGIALKKLDDAAVPLARTSELYLQYALTYRDQHDWNHAAVIKRLNRALEKGDPDDADVHYQKGLYYLKRRNPDEEAAARSMQRVIDVAPWRCDVFKTLEALYKKLEDDKALEELETSAAAEACKGNDK